MQVEHAAEVSRLKTMALVVSSGGAASSQWVFVALDSRQSLRCWRRQASPASLAMLRRYVMLAGNEQTLGIVIQQAANPLKAQLKAASGASSGQESNDGVRSDGQPLMSIEFRGLEDR